MWEYAIFATSCELKQELKKKKKKAKRNTDLNTRVIVSRCNPLVFN